MNPLGKGPMPQMNGNNPINMMLNMLNSGHSPQQVMQTIANNNPNLNAAINQLKNSSNGRNPRDIAMDMAKQRGIDPAQLEQLAKKMGLK